MSRRFWLPVVTGVLLVAGGVTAAAAGSSASTHPYRHGVVPMLSDAGATKTDPVDDVAYGGGTDGVGVENGPEKVYLVFWGSQWGTAGTNGSGYATYSGDPKGVAPYLQAFFAGLGTDGELWSGVETQYCEGVAAGTSSCPSTAVHVGYPTGGALAGVWEDTSSAEPAAATAHELAQEAETAAGHFGNTTQASNRDVQYVIVSPTGTNPDDYETQGFCAWHDYTGDVSMDGGGAVAGSLVAFTNLPYLPDAGSSCGLDFVNAGAAGELDGISIVEGHEYNETNTDQFPAGGWTVPSGSSAGEEVGDLCAWISSGQGASSNLTLSTGTFAVQSIWANDFGGGSGGCELSHAIVTNANTVTVTNPGAQSSTVSSRVSLQLYANDSDSGQSLTWSATGLPAGLSINSSTGVISGTPTAAGISSVKATATDGTAASGSASFAWTIVSAVTVTNPGAQTTAVGQPVSLQVEASEVRHVGLSYAATGLPPGLAISGSTGLISGQPSQAGAYSVTVTATVYSDAARRRSTSSSVTFAWRVLGPGYR